MSTNINAAKENTVNTATNVYYVNPERPRYAMHQNGFECSSCHYTVTSNKINVRAFVNCPQCGAAILPTRVGHRKGLCYDC